MQSSRRAFLLGGGATLAAASAVGYKDMLSAAITLKDNGTKAKDSIYGDSDNCEFIKGKLNTNFKLLPSVCNGCTTHCGIRVKIDKDDNVIRAFGNPYSLLSSDPWLPFNTAISKSFSNLENQSNIASMCARGNIVFDKLKDKSRITKCLKRVGKRGENKWQEIEPEELIKQIVEGGDLFGEGHVKGLRETRDLNTLIDENSPEFGAMVNKLCIIGTGDEGRQKYIQQRFMQSFGTINFMGHTAICGLSMRAGEAAYLNDFKKFPHLKPDFENCKFLLNIATAPSQAGNPFKRQAKLLARARSEKDCKYVTVTPNLTNADTYATPNSSWLPIKPGGDLALVMGMIREIIEKEMYLKEYLQIPSPKAQKELNEASHTNATHLVIVKNGKNGEFLKQEKDFFVIENGVLKKSSEALKADLEFDDELEFEGQMLHLRTSFTILKQNAYEYSLDEYAKFSGVKKHKIQELAKEFCSHGRAVGVDCHGGTMHSTGFYTTYAIMMLGGLVGSLNHKGGMSSGGGRFKDFVGDVYNLFAYKDKVKPKGVRVDKSRFAYEKTSEFKQKVANGENPYPSKTPWYPLANAIVSDIIANSQESYPYKLDCLISWCANVIYGQSGAMHTIEALKDPKKSIPLFIAIDPFINETSKFADFIVPDSVMYETWGVVAPWGGSQTKANHLRFPIIKSPNVKFKNGETVCMDSFVIELGKALNLGGFGKNAIKGQNGEFYELNKPSDFYLRAFENIAVSGKEVDDISDEEFEFSGLGQMYEKKLQEISPKNWRKIAYIMARGGRFADKKDSYDGNFLKKKYQNTVAFYNENLAKFKNSLTGKSYSGAVKYYEARYANDEKLELDGLLAFSYKSNVFSSPTSTSEALKDLKYTNFIEINPKTAKELGIKNSDLVKVSSKGGEVVGICKIRAGIHPQSIGVEHGVGRSAEGANEYYINGVLYEANFARKSGIWINKLGLKDPNKGESGVLSDFIIGSNTRQAIPVKIEKV